MKDKMAEYVSGKRKAYAFHINWTLNNGDKLRFLRELGWWMVNDTCANASPKDVAKVKNVADCCDFNIPPEAVAARR
jgi:hypothetical protein